MAALRTRDTPVFVSGSGVCAKMAAARTVPPQVRKSLELKSPPEASRIYSLTSCERTRRGSPASSTYWKSCCPGRSWMLRMIFAMRRSTSFNCHSLPDLPLNRNRSFAPSTSTWRPRSVVSPKLLLSRAYCALPTRIIVLSSSHMIDATTRSHDSDRFRRSASTAARIAGSARAKAARLEYLASSRHSSQRG